MESLEDMQKLKNTIDKWQNEIMSTFNKGGEIRIKKAKYDFIIYQNLLKKIK